MTDSLPKGSTISLLGNGQLGRMFIQSAKRHGYKVACWGPGQDSPCAQIADFYYPNQWNDWSCIQKFLKNSSVITTELEQVPADLLDELSLHAQLCPSAQIIKICQDRKLEKNWLRDHGLPVTEFRVVQSERDFVSAIRELGLPCVAKTTGGGYDGKGQRTVKCLQDVEHIWKALGPNQLVVERLVPFVKEISVICARDSRGTIRTFPIFENVHSRHILAMTIFPARISQTAAQRAKKLATEIAEYLELQGLLTVEMFLLEDDRILVNELAPRPHNSGHVTIEACKNSQFDYQVFILTRQPLPEVEVCSPGIMINLLGELWSEGEPDLNQLSTFGQAHIHLYGKSKPLPGRKMGHVTFTNEITKDIEEQLLSFAQQQSLKLLANTDKTISHYSL